MSATFLKLIDLTACKKLLKQNQENLTDKQIIALRDYLEDLADIAIVISYDTPNSPRKKSSPDVQSKYG